MKHPNQFHSSLPRRTVLSRRRFLRHVGVAGATGITASILNSRATWASDAPEVTNLKFGIIALTDCSPIVIAHEKGLCTF